MKNWYTATEAENWKWLIKVNEQSKSWIDYVKWHSLFYFSAKFDQITQLLSKVKPPVEWIICGEEKKTDVWIFVIFSPVSSIKLLKTDINNLKDKSILWVYSNFICFFLYIIYIYIYITYQKCKCLQHFRVLRALPIRGSND